MSLVSLARDPVSAAVILQGSGSQHVAFEAEGNAQVIVGTPESWVQKTDAQASGGGVLLADGPNDTAGAPHSFAQYQVRFAAAGDYYLFYRWKADEGRTAGDQFTANSCWFSRPFAALNTPGDPAPYVRAEGANATTAPANNVYQWSREAETVAWTVAASDMGKVVVFTMGTREAGMIVDRILFSTDPTLIDNPAMLEGLPNSETDVVVQGAGESFVAFEAEAEKATVIPGTPEFWARKADAQASGGGALLADGPNDTAGAPHSFAQYQIRFGAAGDYYLFYRWKADEGRTAGDQFTANSCWFSRPFAALNTPGDPVPYVRAEGANATTAPANNVYQWSREADTVLWTVTESEVEKVVVFTMGTREAGMTVDRIVFSPDGTLIDNPASLDALPNSGTKPPAPELKGAVSSAALVDVTVSFSRPLNPTTVIAGNFRLSGGVTVTDATLDTSDARVVRLKTPAQAEGVAYVLTVDNVKDTAGTTIAPNSTISFTAWKRVDGWVTKEIYFTITGATVAEFTAAQKYLDRKPDLVEYVRGFGFDREPVTDNYGVRLSAFFTPSGGGSHEFFAYNDDEAEVLLSSDSTEANLQSLGLVPLAPRGYTEAGMVTSGPLNAGARYLLVGLLKQGGGDVYLSLASRPQGDTTTPEQLAELAGGRISTFVNPDLGRVAFLRQPSAVSVPAGSRARFEAQVETAVQPVYFQWQVNGVDIPGATRAAYYTPVAGTADSGKRHRVIVSVAGIDTPSTEGLLTVTPGEPSNLVPYIGVNFVGGGTLLPKPISPQDVAGVYLQENWNNLEGFTFDPASPVPLRDAADGGTPVSFSASPLTEGWYSGTLETGDSNGALLQGLVTAGTPAEPVILAFQGVPTGAYHVLVYSVGFNFSPAYEQDYALTAGGAARPVITGRCQTGLQYVANPQFQRMVSTDPANRDSGNYVQFDSVAPAADGSIQVSVTWAGTGGNTHQPAINAVQLVKVNPVVSVPRFSGVSVQGGNVTLTWSGGQPPYTLQERASLSALWVDVRSTDATTLTLPLSGAANFYRLKTGP